MTREQLEASGFHFFYREHFGRTVEVQIWRTEPREHVCSHWNTDGAVDYFNRRNYAGQLTKRFGLTL